MSDDLHNSRPDSTPEIGSLEARRNELLRLHEAMQAKLKASPKDFGVRVWWGFVIVGLLIGRMRTFDVWSVLLYGVAFWIAGMCFSVFALDSAEVQSRIAIFLHKVGERHVSNWLYQRALTTR